MKKLNILLIVLILFLTPGILISQTYDLQFIEELNDGNNFNVRVQIKASSAFLLASSNIAFNFNSAGLSNPALLAAYNFSGTSYGNIFITQPKTGVVYINIHYLSYTNSATATNVSTDWMDVASIGFTTTNSNVTSNLSFRSASPSNTVLYSCSGANPMIFTPQTAGTWFTLDKPLHSLPVVLKIFLEGPYNGAGAMTTSLNSIIPLNSNVAYSTIAYSYTASTVVSIPNSTIVDWVLVELRTGTASGTKVGTRAAFLKSDGTIVDVDGSGPVRFTGLSAGNYYIVVRHRNHLAIMSLNAVALSVSSSLYDFTTAQAQAYGTNPMEALPGGGFGMIGADGNKDGGIYGEDYILYQTSQGNEGYISEDYNLDGGAYGEDYILYQLNQGYETWVP